MATPVKRSFHLIAADGSPLHGDLRSASGVRPAVVMCHDSQGSPGGAFLPELADRLARAGFAVVSFDHPDLECVLNGLRRGTVGLTTETYALIGHGSGGSIALQRTAEDERVCAVVTLATVAPLNLGNAALRARWLDLPGPPFQVEQVARASVDWLARHLK